MADAPMAGLRRHWLLDPAVAFLNHGSFGACPIPVLEAQRALRDEMERGPILFLHREIERRIDEAREALAAFLGTGPSNLAFVPNATTAINAVIASLRFEPGDELLATDHEYNATLNALRAAAERHGARVVIARIPFPIADPDAARDAILARVTARTRLALVSHVTSPTALVLPIAEIVRALDERGVDTIVDGAHAPGMVPLDIDAVGAAYYAGNNHKWLCSPKGSGFLAVRGDRGPIRPLVLSHGVNDPRVDRSRYHLEFDWPGTADPTPHLAVPEAIRFVGSLVSGGWPEVMRRNRAMALAARDLLAATLGVDRPAPDTMIGSIASLPLAGVSPEAAVALQARLYERHGIEVPLPPFPVAAALDEGREPSIFVRVSAQLYNEPAEYDRLAAALAAELAQPAAGGSSAGRSLAAE